MKKYLMALLIVFIAIPTLLIGRPDPKYVHVDGGITDIVDVYYDGDGDGNYDTVIRFIRTMSVAGQKGKYFLSGYKKLRPQMDPSELHKQAIDNNDSNFITDFTNYQINPDGTIEFFDNITELKVFNSLGQKLEGYSFAPETKVLSLNNSVNQAVIIIAVDENNNLHTLKISR